MTKNRRKRINPSGRRREDQLNGWGGLSHHFFLLFSWRYSSRTGMEPRELCITGLWPFFKFILQQSLAKSPQPGPNLRLPPQPPKQLGSQVCATALSLLTFYWSFVVVSELCFAQPILKIPASQMGAWPRQRGLLLPTVPQLPGLLKCICTRDVASASQDCLGPCWYPRTSSSGLPKP